MNWTFLSNYYTHHQKAICEELDARCNSFIFLSTEKFDDERKKLGWNEENNSFVRECSNLSEAEICNAVNDADTLIFGAAPLGMIADRLRSNRLVLKYSERVFKRGYQPLKWLPRLFLYRKNYGRYKSFYLLCASAYTAVDYAIHGTFLNKAYKWGYFPETKKYNTDELLDNKNHAEILWCGRFLDWKHPDDAIEVARRLRKDGYKFKLTMIGAGETKSQLFSQTKENHLEDYINFVGSKTPDEVRLYMESAGIFLFTSDFQEGWGAVLNESMNSGCAVVASHAAGSVPYLIKNNDNGFIYKNGDVDDLYNKVKILLDNPEKQRSFGKKAYHTIVDLWNAEVAVQRLVKLSEEINDHGYCDIYEDGPCSKAPIISNNWFKG